MLAEIETAIETRLAAKAPQLTLLDISKGAPVLPAGPAYMVQITRGQAEKAAAEAVKQNANISLWLAFKNLKNEKARRHGIYPVVEAVAQFLMFQALGLNIKPISYTGFSEVTAPEEREAGMLIFQLDFETAYTVNKLEEEAAEDLLTVGLSYLLNGAAPAAAQDEVTVQTI
jgi:hypothetical protein